MVKNRICRQSFLLQWMNSPPVFFNSSAQRDLFSNLGTHRLRQHYLRQISLDGEHPTTSRQRADVHHQHLVLGKFLDLDDDERSGGHVIAFTIHWYIKKNLIRFFLKPFCGFFFFRKANYSVKMKWIGGFLIGSGEDLETEKLRNNGHLRREKK